MLTIFFVKLTVFWFLPYLTVQDKVMSDGIIFNYNNTYKYNKWYTVHVNKSTEYILEFAGDLQNHDTPARVTVASNSANSTYPLFITARQQKGIFSWQLPMLVQTPMSQEQFTNISRTLCPHNNLFDEHEETCDISTKNTPIIHLTSSSPVTLKVTIMVQTVKDFYVKLNSTTTLTITPSKPEYYFYPFKQEPHKISDLSIQSAQRKYICNKELSVSEQKSVEKYYLKGNMVSEYSWLSKPKSVILLIESEDDICAVVSIQNFSCPVFDNERDILYDGYYLTMTRRGGITLTQDTFPVGFFIVFIVKSSDADCVDSSSNATVPNVAHYFGWSRTVNVTASDGRAKTFSFRIVETISYEEYMIAAGAALSFFGSFYVAFFLVIICHRRKTIAVSVTDASVEGAEGLTPPLVPHDNASVPGPLLRQALLAGGEGSSRQRQYVSDDLATSSERNEVMADSTVPHEDCTPVVARRRNTSGMQASGESTSRQWLMAEDELTGTPVRTEYSSSSDTESEFSTLDDANTEKDLYLLGGKLCLLNLSRCRPKVLSKRSNMYLWNVVTVAIFYTLPVIQLVVTYQRLLNQSGNQDLCYFNFLCAHPLAALSDFNHVYSNLGYVLLGTLFLLQVWRRHAIHRARTLAQKELGIPQHFGLLYAMGIALVSEGLLSAAYHVCPNSMNFQFDTSFMYVTSVLCMVKIYQSRHPDINARAHVTFGVLALIIFIGLVGVLNANFYFWVMFTALHLTTCLVMTFQIYYMGRFRPDGSTLYRAARELVTHPLAALTPARLARCVLLFIANLANWAIAAYGVAQHSRDFASHLLLVLMSNLFLYTLFYIVMKLLYRESIRWYTWVFICLTYSIWSCSSYFYLDQSTNWALTPAQSRQSNRMCSLLDLYDSHDVWHFLSSTAMFFSFNMYLTIDDNLSSVHRRDIKVF